MKSAIAILTLTSCLVAQTPSPPKTKTVLIVLRQPEGPLQQRLAAIPKSTPVPEEVKTAARSELESMIQAQQKSFDSRLSAAGATVTIHYPELNIVRAQVPAEALPALQLDPDVLSLTPVSGDALPGAPAPGVGVQPPVPSPLAVSTPAPAVAGMKNAGAAGAFLPAVGTPTMPGSMPGMMPGSMPGMAPGTMPGMMPGAMPGIMPGSLAGTGMFQSLLGVTSQMSAQAGMVMPRSAGIMMLLAGGAQIAQVIAANHKRVCSFTVDTATAKVPAAGGQGSVLVHAPASCMWQAQSNADWLQIDAAGLSTGVGLVRYTALPAAGASRSGVITIAEIARSSVNGKASVTVTQGQ